MTWIGKSKDHDRVVWASQGIDYGRNEKQNVGKKEIDWCRGRESVGYQVLVLTIGYGICTRRSNFHSLFFHCLEKEEDRCPYHQRGATVSLAEELCILVLLSILSLRIRLMIH